MEPGELLMVDNYVDVFTENIETIDIEQVPSGEAGDTLLSFGSPTGLNTIVVPVVTSTLSKVSEYFAVDKLKEKTADKKKKIQGTDRARTIKV